jgi:putative glutamine amidotransferase
MLPLMKRRPLILVSPSIDIKGTEFADLSVSLSLPYERALIAAGLLPWPVVSMLEPTVMAECVQRADGVLLTGGEDIAPEIYAPEMTAKLKRKCVLTGDGGQRDLRELVLVREVFRQRKPLLAICRGHQLLNVALGGTLVADIATQVAGALNHRRMDKRSAVVHEVSLTPGGLLGRITGRRNLGVNSTHHQCVDRVADVLQVAARSADGVVEAMQLQPAAALLLPFLLSVQFHPERLAEKHGGHRAIFAAFAKACATHSRRK